MAVGPKTDPQGVVTIGRPPMSLLTVPGVVVTNGNERQVMRPEAGVGVESDDCHVPLSFTAGTSDYPYWYQCQASGGTAPTTAFETSGGAGDGTKVISAGEGTDLFDAIQLWAGYKCRTGSAELAAESQVRARRKLEALTPAAVERELWTAAIANLAGYDNPAFVDAGLATLVGSGTPLGFVTALGELEQAIADSTNVTSPVIIHAQPRVVTAWASMNLVDMVPGGTHLVTAAGTIVVPERGATGGSPGAISPAQTANRAYSWAYATGMVSVWLTAPVLVDPQESVIRSVNTIEVRAERSFVAAWNPCTLLAARVALCDLYCTGGS